MLENLTMNCAQKHRSNPHVVSDPAYIISYSSTICHHVARMLVTLAAVLVVSGPTFALQAVNSPLVRLVLVLVFSLAFATVLAVTTICKNQEIFAIVAS